MTRWRETRTWRALAEFRFLNYLERNRSYNRKPNADKIFAFGIKQELFQRQLYKYSPVCFVHHLLPWALTLDHCGWLLWHPRRGASRAPGCLPGSVGSAGHSPAVSVECLHAARWTAPSGGSATEAAAAWGIKRGIGTDVFTDRQLPANIKFLLKLCHYNTA